MKWGGDDATASLAQIFEADGIREMENARLDRCASPLTRDLRLAMRVMADDTVVSLPDLIHRGRGDDERVTSESSHHNPRGRLASLLVVHIAITEFEAHLERVRLDEASPEMKREVAARLCEFARREFRLRVALQIIAHPRVADDVQYRT